MRNMGQDWGKMPFLDVREVTVKSEITHSDWIPQIFAAPPVLPVMLNESKKKADGDKEDAAEEMRLWDTSIRLIH